MASQEQIPCSLPDTQNADVLTQSQGVLSQESTLIVWGRLCPNLNLSRHASLKSIGKDYISLHVEITCLTK